MISGKYWLDQFEDLSIFGSGQPWHLASPPISRTRVPRPPAVPSHTSAALEAQTHVLVERAAAFAPPAMLAVEHRPHLDPMPHLLGVQPF